MLFDFNEAFTRANERKYDFCICGTGPAGITLARRLAAAGKSILLLEGGDIQFTERSQDLYKVKSIGIRYWNVDMSRLRFFGGTSNHWAGRCGKLDSIDFEDREYYGLPGWPIPRDEVMKFEHEAKEILDISGANLDPVEYSEEVAPVFTTGGYALSPPTRFSEKYGSEIRKSNQIDCFYNANLIDLELKESKRSLESLLIKNFDGHAVPVSATRYVLALGAIENARMLLNASNQVSAGVGNHNGMVGRCFMEHLNVPIGRFIVTDPQFWDKGSVPLAPREDLLKQNKIGNGVLNFEPNANPQSSGRLRILKQFLRETGCSLPAVANLARQIVDFDCPGDGLITSLIEQAPNPNSQVSLTSEIDVFGLRRAEFNWQLGDRDFKTIRVIAMAAAKEMARLNRARVQLSSFILDPLLAIEVGPHGHHMGTTRMSRHPRHGVVDPNCQVHDVENLFLIGSSVFSTGGGTNPTLTIVQLALRLADYLSKM